MISCTRYRCFVRVPVILSLWPHESAFYMLLWMISFDVLFCVPVHTGYHMYICLPSDIPRDCCNDEHHLRVTTATPDNTSIFNSAAARHTRGDADDANTTHVLQEGQRPMVVGGAPAREGPPGKHPGRESLQHRAEGKLIALP